MTRIGRSVMVFVLAAAVWPVSVEADQVWRWRGDGTGVFPDATPPTEWGPDTNVIWKVPMPKHSNASPIIVGEKIFVCADPSTLICVNKADGKILWQKTNELREMYTEAEWKVVEERTAARKKLVGEQNQARGQDRKLGQQLNLSTQKQRDAHTAGLKKRWDKQAEAAKKQGKTIKPFKAPDYGPLPTAEQIAEMKAKRAELRKQQKDLGEQIKAYDDVRPTRVNGINGRSTMTPVTDGTHVYVLFATGAVACYDLEGNRQWMASVGPSTNGYGQAASPVLAGQALLVPVNGVKALDKATGKVVWEQTKAKTVFGTPFPVTLGGQQAVVTGGGEVVSVSDGQILATGLGAFAYASPVVDDGVAFVLQGAAQAMQLPASANDAKPKRLWRVNITKDRYYGSAVVYKGVAYGVTQKGVTTALDAGNGKVLWSEKLAIAKTAYPSIVAAGEYVFVSSDTGDTAVLKAGREFQLVRINKLGAFRSSPVFEGGRMYVRSYKHLYCIGK